MTQDSCRISSQCDRPAFHDTNSQLSVTMQNMKSPFLLRYALSLTFSISDTAICTRFRVGDCTYNHGSDSVTDRSTSVWGPARHGLSEFHRPGLKVASTVSDTSRPGRGQQTATFVHVKVKMDHLYSAYGNDGRVCEV